MSQLFGTIVQPWLNTTFGTPPQNLMQMAFRVVLEAFMFIDKGNFFQNNCMIRASFTWALPLTSISVVAEYQLAHHFSLQLLVLNEWEALFGYGCQHFSLVGLLCH